MKVLKRLLASRKFWVAIVTLAAKGLAAVGGGPAGIALAVAETAVWVGPILIGAIAVEDAAEKIGKGK